MKPRTLMLTAGAVALISVLGVAAVAHEGAGYGWHGGGSYHYGGDWGHTRHGQHRMGMLAKLKQLDVDNDGSVTLEEFLKPKEIRFAELDTEGKGSIGPEALVTRERAELDYRIKRVLKRYDADNDGRITKGEFEKPARDRFAKRDLNGDGKITDDELMPDLRRTSDEADDGEVRDHDRYHEGRHHRHAHRYHHRHHHWHHHHRGEGWDMRGARSLDKVLRRVGERFDRLDANVDGVLDRDELAGKKAERITFKQRRRMHVLDTNKDGSVSKEEFLAERTARFSMIDLNGDGKITAEDLPPRAARFWERKAEGQQDK